ncbi:MAG: hypothetical protein LC797_00145 [Chloroflexi bacterium]|nr:hypothetical protein [Chloroflexota bacterium]
MVESHLGQDVGGDHVVRPTIAEQEMATIVDRQMHILALEDVRIGHPKNGAAAITLSESSTTSTCIPVCCARAPGAPAPSPMTSDRAALVGASRAPRWPITR